MNENEDGCCGRPQSCTGTFIDGRCKAREDFEDAQKPKRRRNSLEAFFGDDLEGLAIARERQAKQARRNKDRSRSRAEGGRSLSR